MKKILAICILAFAATAMAQQPTEKPKAVAPAVTAPANPQPAQLSQIEVLQLKNIQLEFQSTQQAIQLGNVHLQELRGSFLQYVAEVEKAHPGYTLDGNGNLIEKPKPAKPEAKK